MIKVKTPLSPLELSIVSGIDDVQANHIKFHNISFCCDSIEDCERRVFTQRKKGKWMPVNLHENPNQPDSECSVCGYVTYYFWLTNFCPNCGADMREGEQDDNRRV
jgi:hypothetical protein